MDEEICRFCLKRKDDGEIDEFFNVFATTVNEANATIASTAAELAPFEFKENDDFPQQICDVCFAKLRITYEFIKTGLKSQEYLKNLSSMISDLEKKFVHQINGEVQCQNDNNSLNVEIQTNQNKTSKKKRSAISKCDECSKPIKKENMKIHKMIHSGERPYSCEFCYKRFHQVISVYKHKKLHHKDRVSNTILQKSGRPRKLKWILCEKCEVKFENKTAIQNHVCESPENKPFKCRHCPATFLFEHNLKNHLRRHPKRSFQTHFRPILPKPCST